MSPSRHIAHSGNQLAVDALYDALETICGTARRRSFQYNGGTYFNVEADIAGTGNELVVIGAHLDSTAANDPGYAAAVDDAPGADDDLSGVSGVLEVAQVLRDLADLSAPQRSIRFALFNAEEQWMRGSWAWAHDLKELEDGGGLSVVAMLAMDMIGWHSTNEPPGPPYVFEVHGAGTANTEYKTVAAASRQLSQAVVQAATLVAPNLAAQVYPLVGCATDPATGRSDHSSFHYHDWPACLLSEDLWVEVCAAVAKPSQSGNPHYHRASDLAVHLDFDYAADIARSVATTAWMIANP